MQRLVTAAFVFAFAGAAHAADPGCTWQQDDPNDQVGMSRTQTPAKALSSIQLVRTGEIHRLAHVLDEVTLGTPPFGRVFDVTMVPFSFPDLEDPNSQHFNSGGIQASIGQIATQFDGLGHAGHDMGYYNCFTPDEVGPDELGRLDKLGVENVKPFFTRAVLLDFVRHSSAPKITVDGREMLADSYTITMENVNEVLAAQGVEPPSEGDVALFYTGWDSLFGFDNERHFFSPGPGLEVAEWLAGQKVAMLGTDTQHSEAAVEGRSTELTENDDLMGAEFGFIFNHVHFLLITQHGIHLMEWMLLDELATAMDADAGSGASPYEVLFIYAPLRIKGLGGAPGNAIAVR